MKSKACFAMGLHFHQPVGNFDRILERAYCNCYKPFLDVAVKYPHIKMTFHFSGNLLDYFEANHPEFIDRVRSMVFNGQIEIMGGGYYEPIFQAIPQRDRIGQIEMLSSYCKKRFSVELKGIWIPERVWVPGLVEDFHRCGMTYSILDDTHLTKTGLPYYDLLGYFMTGDKERKIAVFPSDRKLRYTIPFKPVSEAIDYFRNTARREKDPLFVYGDDVEKFGEWPLTYNWVYKKKWLEKFFRALTDNQDWIKVVTFSEYISSHAPLKDVRIPESSYEEMMQWSGGSWMNFLSRYPESDQMHKRMMYVSDRVAGLGLKAEGSRLKGKLEEARKELYKGQTNCPYWHGVFGGIYLYHLRKAIFEHLINADRICDEIEGKRLTGQARVKEIDFYNKNTKAVILEDKNFFICVDPSKGGVIRELDYKTKSVNLINTLTRHKEAYHKRLLDRINNRLTEPLEPHERIKTINRRMKDNIFYDRYTRSCLVEHFIARDLKMKDFANCDYVDIGDFANNPYSSSIEGQGVVMVREGMVGDVPVRNTKQISMSSDNEIKISYILENTGSSVLDTFFGTEFNVSMPYADSNRYHYEPRGKRLNKKGAVSKVDFFAIRDSQGEFGVELIFSPRPKKIWHFPILTVSQSERAYEFNYQCSCMFPIWQVKLQSKEEMRIDIAWNMLHSVPIFQKADILTC